MSKSKKQTHHEEYLIKCNGQPIKCMNFSRQGVARFMTRLNMRFPHVDWSVSNRFPFYGTD